MLPSRFYPAAFIDGAVYVIEQQTVSRITEPLIYKDADVSESPIEFFLGFREPFGRRGRARHPQKAEMLLP